MSSIQNAHALDDEQQQNAQKSEVRRLFEKKKTSNRTARREERADIVRRSLVRQVSLTYEQNGPTKQSVKTKIQPAHTSSETAYGISSVFAAVESDDDDVDKSDDALIDETKPRTSPPHTNATFALTS